MKIPTFTNKDIKEKSVLIRADLDLSQDKNLWKKDRRLDVLVDLLEKIYKDAKRMVVIAHRGRPQGEEEKFSLKEVADKLEELLEKRIGKNELEKIDLELMENLRFNKKEEENDDDFAKHLVEGFDVFINEAFATSHREHASIVGIPKHIKSFAGPHFVKEVESLEKVIKNPKKPILFMISGYKDDKLQKIPLLEKNSDMILIGGRLPDYIHDSSPLRKKDKILVANLIADKEDITINSIEKFKNEIKKAKTIVVSGPLGKFEEDAHSQGTKEILNAVGDSNAYKIVGGGETEAAVEKFGLTEKIDWISVGGGAMLEFLSSNSLPGIKALLN